MQACSVCGDTAGERTHWDRIAPPSGSLDACEACAARFVRWADDRANDSEENYRILGLRHRLGGEVWRVGERTFWYREPLHPAATTMLDAPPPPPPSPYTSFLYEMAGASMKGIYTVPTGVAAVAPKVASAHRAPGAPLGRAR